jgi:hypothetical protein
VSQTRVTVIRPDTLVLQDVQLAPSSELDVAFSGFTTTSVSCPGGSSMSAKK